jgi:23S rRNA (guanosine2251-2'-O)-methyltransferase
LKKDQLVYGTRAIIEAIKSGKEIDKVLVKKGMRNPLYAELNQLLLERDVPIQSVPIKKLNRITSKNHQGTIAFISSVIYQDIEQIIPMLYEDGKTPLIIILDSVTDVRNLGAISRTAECSGAHAIVIPAKGSAQINADAIKTSAGALNLIPVCRSNNLKDTLDFLKDSGLQIIAASEKSSENYTTPDYKVPTAIIMGSEERGVSAEYLKRTDIHVQIPILGKIESLNVSAAAAVLLYEVIRQRSRS